MVQSSKRQRYCLDSRNSRVPNAFEVLGTSRERPMSAKRRAANQCAQCGFLIIAPEWSQYLSERCVRHSWSCEMCGYQFESTIHFPASELAVDLQAA
jgi:ribosomal protein L37AE/L43A